MNEYYNDMMLSDMKPFTLLHRLGVNGKQSGSLAAVQEIPKAVAVIFLINLLIIFEHFAFLR